MSVVLGILLISIAVVVCYKLYKFRKVKKQLNWVATISGWPILGNALEIGSITDAIFNISRILQTYGKVLLLDLVMQPLIITNDYDFIEFLLSTNHVLSKSQDYKYLRNWLGNGLLTSEGQKWKRRRRMLTPAFHFSILEKFVEAFESNGRILVQLLNQEIDKDSVDIYPFINLYALDVICESAMGIRMEAQTHKNLEYVRNVKEMCRIVIDRSSSLLKTNDFFYMLSRDFYTEKSAVKKLHEVTYSVIDKRRKQNETTSNPKKDDAMNYLGYKRKVAFLDILLESTDENGVELSREDIREEVDTFMFEGHDTTSSAMSFTLYLLANNAEVQDRVLEEQKLIFSDEIHRNITYKDLQKMRYLEQVIKESLRIYPPVPMFGRYTTADITYKGKFIPKGINIIVYSYGVLNDPDNFPNPEQFDPCRFETMDGKRPFNFIPFSAGPRNCIGQKFAMLEIKSTISKLVRNFKLLPASPEHKLLLIPEAVLKSKSGIKIKISKRNYCQKYTNKVLL